MASLIQIIPTNLIQLIPEEVPEVPAGSLIEFRQKNPLVDQWIPEKEDIIFKHTDKAIILPVSNFYRTDNTSLDYFMLTPKRCYNKVDVRSHICLYLNYFEKFYDPDHELLSILFRIKYLIDYNKNYSQAEFINHIKRYILTNQSILTKLFWMNEDNYLVELKAKKGRSIASLQYNTKHGKILMMMSILIDMCIPLICHYMHINRIDSVDRFILTVFDDILCMSDVDIASKFFETASTEVNKNYNVHIGLWKMQDIRGKNTTTHSMGTIENIILNIMPKYVYKDNAVSFNFSSIKRSNGYKITDIKYEFTFRSFSSSNRDEDFNSDFDKFESNLIREDEGLYLQNKVASEYAVKYIRDELTVDQFGPITQDEIEFYRERLQRGGCEVITKFQKKLIFNLFYKYFGDPVSADAINQDDYLALMIAAKRILLSSQMIILPYIISGKIIFMPNKKSVNNKELMKIQQSPLWKLIEEKYKSPKILNDILAEIACLISGEFEIIEYDPDLADIDGKTLSCISDILSEEYMMYILLI